MVVTHFFHRDETSFRSLDPFVCPPTGFLLSAKWPNVDYPIFNENPEALRPGIQINQIFNIDIDIDIAIF